MIHSVRPGRKRSGVVPTRPCGRERPSDSRHFSVPAVFEEPEDPSNRSFFSEITSSVSDVKFSHSGRYMLTRDYLTVKVWDLNMEARPIETYQVSRGREAPSWRGQGCQVPLGSPPHPPPAPSRLRSTITFGASSVPSMRTTAFSTSSNVPGTGATGNLQTGGRGGGPTCRPGERSAQWGLGWGPGQMLPAAFTVNQPQ